VNSSFGSIKKQNFNLSLACLSKFGIHASGEVGRLCAILVSFAGVTSMGSLVSVG